MKAESNVRNTIVSSGGVLQAHHEAGLPFEHPADDLTWRHADHVHLLLLCCHLIVE